MYTYTHILAPSLGGRRPEPWPRPSSASAPGPSFSGCRPRSRSQSPEKYIYIYIYIYCSELPTCSARHPLTTCVCVYIYIYIYICMYLSLSLDVYTYIYIYIHTYILFGTPHMFSPAPTHHCCGPPVSRASPWRRARMLIRSSSTDNARSIILDTRVQHL